MHDDKKKVLLFGGTGMIGSRFSDLMHERFFITAPIHKEVDVRDIAVVGKTIEMLRPDYIVYAAGLTKVDEAEKEKERAYHLNTDAVENIAGYADFLSIPLYYLSTDAVFDGLREERAYKETDIAHPISIYGKSKLNGERAVLQINKNNCVVRLISVFSAIYRERPDFVRLTIEGLRNNQRLAGIVDQVSNPLYVDYAVYAIAALMQRKASGIYHLGATDYCSNYELAIQIASLFSLDEALIYPISHEEFFRGKAPRGKYSRLDTTKFVKEFGVGILHTIMQSLSDFKKHYR